MHVWRTSTRVSLGIVSKLIVLLGNEERAKAARFRRDADRDRYVASHAMLRLVLSRYVGASAEKLEFEVGDRGKPRLAQGRDFPLSFNLSHSGDAALLAVSGTPEVGVDLEEIRDDVDVRALSRSALSAAELRVLHSAPIERQRLLFFRSWVRKEAVLKGCGVGLSAKLEQVVVLGSEASKDEEFTLVQPSASQTDWGVRDIEIGDRYAGAAAAPGRDWTLHYFEHRWCGITESPDAPEPDRDS